MRKTLLFAAVAIAVTAVAQNYEYSMAKSWPVLTTTCGDAGLTSTSGASIENAYGYNTVLTADRNDGGLQTLFATGTLQCCFYGSVCTDYTFTQSDGGTGVNTNVCSGYSRRWMECPSSLNVTVSSVCNTGARDCVTGDFQVPVGVGRVAFVPSSLVVDGGTSVTITTTVRQRK